MAELKHFHTHTNWRDEDRSLKVSVQRQKCVEPQERTS